MCFIIMIHKDVATWLDIISLVAIARKSGDLRLRSWAHLSQANKLLLQIILTLFYGYHLCQNKYRYSLRYCKLFLTTSTIGASYTGLTFPRAEDRKKESNSLQ